MHHPPLVRHFRINRPTASGLPSKNTDGDSHERGDGSDRPTTSSSKRPKSRAEVLDFSLSSKTLNLIREAKERRATEALQDTTAPATADLHRQRELPEQWAIFPVLVETLDTCLNIFAVQNEVAFWGELLGLVPLKVQKDVTVRNVLTLMALQPIYSLSWQVDPVTGAQDMVLEAAAIAPQSRTAAIPRAETNARMKLIKDLLIGILIEKGFYENRAVLESIQLPCLELPRKKKQVSPVKGLTPASSSSSRPRPQDTSTDETGSHLKSSVLHRLKGLGILPPPNTAAGTPSPVPSSSSQVSHLRERIMEEIARKTRVAARTASAYNDDVVGDNTFLTQFATLLCAYYRTRGVSNMFYIQVVDHFRKNFPKPLSLSEIERTISKIVECVPGWLKVVDMAAGKILRMNASIDVDCVKQQLQKPRTDGGLIL